MVTGVLKVAPTARTRGAIRKGTQLQFRREYLPTSPLEDEDEDSLPDEALRSVVGSSVNERSRENDVPGEWRPSV